MSHFVYWKDDLHVKKRKKTPWGQIPNSAIRIGPNTTVQVPKSSTVVWFSVELKRGFTHTSFSFDTLSTTPVVDTYIAAYNLEGVLLASNDDDINSASKITLSSLSPGIYFMAIGLYPVTFLPENFGVDYHLSTPTSDGSIILRTQLDSIEIIAPPTQKNISLALPSSNISVPSSGGVVWYSINTSRSGSLSFDTLGTNEEFDTALALYDSLGNLRIYYDDYTSSTLTKGVVHGLLPGTYYLAVAKWGTGPDISAGSSLFDFISPPQYGGIKLNASLFPYPSDMIAKSQPMFGLYNTGWASNEGYILSDGSIDPHYTILASGDIGGNPKPAIVSKTFFGVNSTPGYLANDSESSFLSGEIGANLIGTTFDLTGYDHTTVSLTLEFQASEAITSVHLNTNGLTGGADIGFQVASLAYTQWHQVVISGGFQSGINSLQIAWNYTSFGRNSSAIRMRVVNASGTLL